MPNRLLSFARLAHQVATDTLPDRAHRFAPKRYTQPQLLACSLVKEYLGLDYRTTQETLEVSDGLREALHLRRVPDYTALWRFAHDKATADVVAHALGETVRLCKTPGHDPPQRALIAIDSTGMPPRRGGRAAATPRATSRSAGARTARRRTAPEGIRSGLPRSGRAPSSSPRSSRSPVPAATTRTCRRWRSARSPRYRAR